MTALRATIAVLVGVCVAVAVAAAWSSREAPAAPVTAPPVTAAGGVTETAPAAPAEPEAAAPVETPAPAARTELAGIQVSFKLDPRLTKSLYMGERWVSPATYVKVQDGTQLALDARAYGLDASGKPKPVAATWTAADPSLVAVTPRGGHQVEIAVRRLGRSSVTVSAGGVSKTLAVNAFEQHGVARVDVSQ